jgi:hypothetical protein
MATVLTFVRKSNGVPLTFTPVIFRPVSSSPTARTGAVVPPNEVEVETNGAGFFSIALFGGQYRVFVGNATKAVLITVPDNDSINLLEDLIAAATGVTKAGVTPVNWQLHNNYTLILDTEDGSFRVIRCAGDASSPTLSIDDSGVVAGPINLRWNSTSLELWNDDAGAWFALLLTGPANAPVLGFGTAGTAAPGNARQHNNKLQLLNLDTGTWHTLFVDGASATFGGPDNT